MKKDNSSEISDEQWKELSALAAMPDDEIDTADAPEVLDWTGARRGLFYRHALEGQMIRVDADVLQWFQAHSKEKESYQAQINQALRQYVSEQVRKAG